MECETPEAQSRFLQSSSQSASESSHVKFNVYAESLVENILPITKVESALTWALQTEIYDAKPSNYPLIGAADISLRNP